MVSIRPGSFEGMDFMPDSFPITFFNQTRSESSSRLLRMSSCIRRISPKSVRTFSRNSDWEPVSGENEALRALSTAPKHIMRRRVRISSRCPLVSGALAFKRVERRSRKMVFPRGLEEVMSCVTSFPGILAMKTSILFLLTIEGILSNRVRTLGPMGICRLSTRRKMVHRNPSLSSRLCLSILRR
ncbi:hypothetical protein BC826DRAFT_1016509, partial [Russula brevipes]